MADRFLIKRLVGRGGMGEVYEAVDLQLRQPVALKTLRGDRVDLGMAEHSFRREVALARRVTHPNVCRIYDLFRHRAARYRRAVA